MHVVVVGPPQVEWQSTLAAVVLQDREVAGGGEEPDARRQVGEAQLTPACEHRQLQVETNLWRQEQGQGQGQGRRPARPV